MKLFFRFLRSRALPLGVFLLLVAALLLSFSLYHLPLAAVWYPAALGAGLGLGALALDYRRTYRRYCALQQLLRQLPTLPQADALPPTDELPQQALGELVLALAAQQQHLQSTLAGQYQDMIDYYTLWAHQIKTPIASMQLCLQQDDSAHARQLRQELSRIEQYVEMVMVYLRLSGGSDLVLRACEVDSLVRKAVRRFAHEFISRRLQLQYEAVTLRCVTDEKWLLFVIEQVLSNALKYTRRGSITITQQAPATLIIRDTGIGIAPEDLPRIFEKGYTGYNGRSDQKASGLGLYLCRRICTKLGHGITAASCPESGTTIYIDLSQTPAAP